ncbi:hypothetical protein IE077_001652 [Cardiosporidium cionae]|uniref:Importin subunit alpha n=1 Tax=Cardiosporidium cionae TaxID=476202 RepID=A0ABQ7JCL0_9APIC|nr:hypothetical protein IE077_001652 [Cardiosporidium cionae]|eukprot:KAF8821735.1 hypothetical protein IE077_001652 [Cardiosporidium cionae]
MTEPDFSRKLKYKQTSLSTRRSFLERHRSVSSIRKDERDRIFSLKRQCDLPVYATDSGRLDESQVKGEVLLLLRLLESHLEEQSDVILMKLRTIRFSIDNSEHMITCVLESGLINLLRKCLCCSHPEIVSEAVCCIASIAAGSREQCSEILEFAPFVMSRYKNDNEIVQKEAAIVLGNISIVFPEVIIRLGAISEVFKVLQNFVDQTNENEAKGSTLLRISLWLLCNIFRSLNERSFEVDIDVSVGLLLCTLLQKILSRPFRVESSFFDGNSSHGAAVSIANLSPKNEWREIVGESLWCLTYLLPAGLRFIEKCRETGIMISIVQLVAEVTTLSSPFPSNSVLGTHWTSPTNFDSCTPTTIASFATDTCIFYNASESLPSNADLLFPSLKILNILCGDPEDTASAPYIIASVAKPVFFEILSHLVQHKHRGVIFESICLFNRLSERNARTVEFVFPILPKLVDILKSAANVDVKRQAALCFLTVITTGERVHMDKLLQIHPSVAEAMLTALESCCRDKELVHIALDFLEVILEFAPSYRQYLYENRAIEIMESAQFEHGTHIERRIAQLVEVYFDDVVDAPDNHNTLL